MQYLYSEILYLACIKEKKCYRMRDKLEMTSGGGSVRGNQNILCNK